MEIALVKRLSASERGKPGRWISGVCATSNQQIDKASRDRCVNITEMVTSIIANGVKMPDGTDANAIWFSRKVLALI